MRIVCRSRSSFPSAFGAGLALCTVAALLCLAAMPRAMASDETVLAANLFDLFRGKSNEQPAEEKPKPQTAPQPKAPTQSRSKPVAKRKAADPQKPVNPGATRVAVVGDSLAQDLWFGLQRAFRTNNNVEVLKYTKSASGLVRDDSYDWDEKLRAFVSEENFSIAVVVFGGNDRQEIRLDGKRLPRFSDAWSQEYANRVDSVIELLNTKAQQVFWVSLPIVRSDRMAGDYEKLNRIYLARSEANGAAFVDIWPQFRDESGAYTSFGPDLYGTKRRLRQDDGLHFTLPGQGRFAEEVLKIMRKTVQLSATGDPVSYADRDAANDESSGSNE